MHMRSVTLRQIAHSEWRNGILPALVQIVSYLIRRALPLAAFFSTAVLAQAHPGHDDGHELTWDFRHLGQHPWATFFWAAGLGFAAWGLSKLMALVGEAIIRSRLRPVRVERRRN